MFTLTNLVHHVRVVLIAPTKDYCVFRGNSAGELNRFSCEVLVASTSGSWNKNTYATVFIGVKGIATRYWNFVKVHFGYAGSLSAISKITTRTS